MTAPPTGTVTFLFTDIEGSTKLAQAHPAEWETARQRHHAILRAAADAHQGFVFQVVGDAFCVAFHNASNAVAASVTAQRALHAETWGETSIRVRMGLHTGAAEARDDDYQGYLTLAHVQRVMSGAHGGQVLLSQATYELVRHSLPDGFTVRDMSEHRLKGLLNPEHLWQVVAPDLPQDFSPLPSLKTIPNNLPIQVTSFVGREHELKELQKLLPTTRLLTLTGSGGTGKTRLSLQVAEAVLDNFKDGVWFIDLAPLADPELLPVTIASVLGVREEPGHPLTESLLEWLRIKELLLILDNCEHLIYACAKFANAAIHSSRGTRILASSREALGIAGEQAFPIPSLQVPDPRAHISVEQLRQYESVRLFVERSRSVKVDFEVTSANAPAVVQICARLDGIPLALELAAARVNSLSVEDIAARLHNQFRLFTGGSRSALPRHQTLRALIDWSYNLLMDSERVLFRRLAVFAGGWTLQAAEQVCADMSEGNRNRDATDILDLLTHLIDKSLVVMESEGGETRYRMLETIRQYAREKLVESGEVENGHDRHLAYFVKLAEEAEPNFHRAEQAVWRMRFEVELDNVRTALAWCIDAAQIAMGLRLVAALDIFWSNTSHIVEGIEIVEKLLALSEGSAQTLLRAKALVALATSTYLRGDLERSTRAAQEALAIGQALHDTRTTALALFRLGRARYLERNFAEARALHEQSVALSRMIDDKPQIALSQGFLGVLLNAMGDDLRAEICFRDSLTLFKTAGDKHYSGLVLRHRGFALLNRHDLSGALTNFREGLRLHSEVGHRIGVLACLAACGAVALEREQFERAAQLFGASEILLEAIRAQMTIEDRNRYTRNVATLSTQLDKATYDAAWAAGRALTLERAIALALRDNL